MPTIHLVRHGESESNRARRFTGHLDSPLSELGRRQAEAAAAALDGCGAARLYVSDLARARQTAEPVARRLELVPMVEPELRERHFGRWENHTMEEIARDWPRDYAIIQRIDFDFRPEGGQSIADLYARTTAWFDATLDGLDGAETVVVVAHGGNIVSILKHVMNLAYNHHLSLGVDNCGITTLDRDHRGHWRVACLNSTAHLSGLTCDGNRSFL